MHAFNGLVPPFKGSKFTKDRPLYNWFKIGLTILGGEGVNMIIQILIFILLFFFSNTLYNFFLYHNQYKTTIKILIEHSKLG